MSKGRIQQRPILYRRTQIKRRRIELVQKRFLYRRIVIKPCDWFTPHQYDKGLIQSFENILCSLNLFTSTKNHSIAELQYVLTGAQ